MATLLGFCGLRCVCLGLLVRRGLLGGLRRCAANPPYGFAGVGMGFTWASPADPGNEDPDRLGMNIQTPGVSVGYNVPVNNKGAEQ